MSVSLSVKQRSLIGSNACKKVRNAGEIPGVLYGEKKDSLSIQFSIDAFHECRSKKEQIVNLEMEGKSQEAIVQKVQYDSLGDNIVHVDFLRISKDKEINVPVDVALKGTPKGTLLGGTINAKLKKLQVTCLPADIPKQIVADISHLEIAQQLRVKELASSDKYKITNHPETTIVIIRAPRKSKKKASDDDAKKKK